VIYIIVSNVKKNVAILNSLSAIFNEFTDILEYFFRHLEWYDLQETLKY